jgi:hypothetical protein
MGPPKESLSLHDDGEHRTVLLPLLLGRVFHVTTRKACRRILSDGAIKSNEGGNFRFTFPQSKNSYFRKKGCVSVFDLRTVTQEVLEWELNKFPFLYKEAFLFLKDSCFERLIPWSHSPNEEVVIPNVEAGYPGDIPVSLIERVLRVQQEYPPPPPVLIDGIDLRDIQRLIAKSDASKVWWAQFTPEQRSAELKRRAKVRAKNAKKASVKRRNAKVPKEPAAPETTRKRAKTASKQAG